MPMPSPRTICAGPAPSPTTFVTNERLLEIIVQLFQRGEFNKIRLANKAIAKFEAASISISDHHHRRIYMEAAIDRIMQTYDLLVNRTTAASDEARAKVTEYVTTLFEAGEKDTHRLTVCGLTYLRAARRQHRSGEGGLYGAVAEARTVALFIMAGPCPGHFVFAGSRSPFATGDLTQ